MNIKPTVTVGLSVYNEEFGIKQLLNSILEQNTDNFVLNKILIMADAPTDKTLDIIKEVNNPLIEVHFDGQRKGVLKRLNEIYKMLDTDILIQTDGDVIFSHKNVINQMVKPLLSENVVMTAGNATPEQPTNFISRAIYYSIKAYENIALNINNGDNINNVHGCILGFKKDFVKNVQVPEEASVNDVYMYYMCKSINKEFKFVKEATVIYRIPKTIKSHITQNVRYKSTSNVVDNYFDSKLVEKELYMPQAIKIKSLLTQILMHPIECLVIFILNKYCDFLATNKKVNPTWDLDTSSRSVYA